MDAKEASNLEWFGFINMGSTHSTADLPIINFKNHRRVTLIFSVDHGGPHKFNLDLAVWAGMGEPCPIPWFCFFWGGGERAWCKFSGIEMAMAWYWWALSKLHCVKPWTSVDRGPHYVAVSFSFLVLFVCFLASHGHGSWVLGIIDYRVVITELTPYPTGLGGLRNATTCKAPLCVLVLLSAHTPMNCVEPQLKDRSLPSLLSVV